MPQLPISEETFQRLSRRAASLNVSLEELVNPALDRLADSPLPDEPVQGEEWQRRFQAWMGEVASRADRYPPGFVVDDSRESIYEGRGE